MMAAAGLEDRTRQASIRGRRLVGPVRSLATRFSSAFGFFSLSGLGAGRLLSLSLSLRDTFRSFSLPFPLSFSHTLSCFTSGSPRGSTGFGADGVRFILAGFT